MEFKNKQLELHFFGQRLNILAGLIIICFTLLVIRLTWLQIVQHQKYIALAENNRITVLPVVPNRGMIKDRNGAILADNYAAYTLEITPENLDESLEDTITQLKEVIDISSKDIQRFKKLLDESKNFASIPIKTRLSDEEVARFISQRYRFAGVDISARPFRRYPLQEMGSHLIGYIGRVNTADAKKIEQSDDAANYRGTQYIGKAGVEQFYEKELHGITGLAKVEVTAGGHAVRTLERSTAIAGNNLILSIDLGLQKIVEEAFGDRRGALVAIDPSTGDILAFVSKPNFDPNLFVEGIDYLNWNQLNFSPEKPLLNRVVRGLYPPGSTYKPYLALAALEMNKRGANDTISDPGYFMFGGHRFRDDKKGGHGIVNMYRSIVESCDTYYYTLVNQMSVDDIYDFMHPFGFGQKTGIDLEGELGGVLPSTRWKRERYKKAEQKKWYAGETVSVLIGQGYNAFTPIQLAHALTILVNDGIIIKPRLVKAIENSQTRVLKPIAPQKTGQIVFNKEHLEFIKNALFGVTQQGTARLAFAGTPYQSAGKTGTAQVVQIKQNEEYDADKLHEFHRDHSLYIGFAPFKDPKIVIATIVENGGFGATAAAPIVRKAFDYYLRATPTHYATQNNAVNSVERVEQSSD